jgi:hypothetical protein
MNKYIYISLIVVSLIIIFTSALKNKYQESFVPKNLKQVYRPLERNVRKKYEGFYNKSSTDISNLFRKFGIL